MMNRKHSKRVRALASFLALSFALHAEAAPGDERTPRQLQILQVGVVKAGSEKQAKLTVDIPSQQEDEVTGVTYWSQSTSREWSHESHSTEALRTGNAVLGRKVQAASFEMISEELHRRAGSFELRFFSGSSQERVLKFRYAQALGGETTRYVTEMLHPETEAWVQVRGLRVREDSTLEWRSAKGSFERLDSSS